LDRRVKEGWGLSEATSEMSPYLGLTGREAEEAEGVAAGEFNNIGWGEAECLEEAAGVTRKIEWEVSWAWGVDAGEGKVLKEHAEFFVVALLRS